MKMLGVGLTALLFVALAPSAFAEWSFTVDTPTSFTFANANQNTTVAPLNKPAPFNHRTTTDVDGSTVALIAPFHIGLGYEDYTVKDSVFCIPCNGIGQTKANFQFYDLLVDVPMRWLNVSLGYGTGTARIDVTLPASANTIVSIAPANATQEFIVLGIPFGRLDLHVGYHQITTDAKTVVVVGGQPPYDKAQASGDMISAGLRLNF